MNTEHLRYFLTVAQCGSISKAAEQLHFKQQYLSGVIKTLENQLGIILFERKSRGVVLTEDGAYFQEKAREALKAIDELQLTYLYPSKAIHRDVVAELVLYTIPIVNATRLGKALALYREYFPNVNINIIERTRPDILRAIHENPLSIGLTLLSDEEQPLQSPDSVRIIPYKPIELVAITRKENPFLKKKATISRDELLNQHLVAYAPKGLQNSLLQRLITEGKDLRIKYTVENQGLFNTLMRQGDYFSVVESNALLDHTLTRVPLEDAPVINSAFLACQEALKNYPIKSFLNLLLLKAGYPIIE